MTQVRPRDSSVGLKTVVNWPGGKAGTQTSLFSFPCSYIPAPIFICSPFFFVFFKKKRPDVINAALRASREVTLEVSHKHRLESLRFSATPRAP